MEILRQVDLLGNDEGMRIVRPDVSGPSYDPAAVAYFAAMTVQPNDARKTLINNLIIALRVNNTIFQLDWLVLEAAHDAQAARINICDPNKLFSENGGPTFVTDRGYSGDGVSSSLRMPEGFPAVGSYTMASGCMGVYATNLAAGSGSVFGTVATTNNNIAVGTSTGVTARIASVGSTFIGTTSGTVKHVCGSRVADVGTIYFQGISIATIPSLVVDNPLNTTIGALFNVRGTFNSSTALASYHGGSLTSAQALTLHNALSSYLTAIGAI